VLPPGKNCSSSASELSAAARPLPTRQNLAWQQQQQQGTYTVNLSSYTYSAGWAIPVESIVEVTCGSYKIIMDVAHLNNCYVCRHSLFSKSPKVGPSRAIQQQHCQQLQCCSSMLGLWRHNMQQQRG
jgi:hypothetical protein